MPDTLRISLLSEEGLEVNFVLIIQANLDLRNSIFPFLNRELFDLRNIYVVNLKTGCPKKMPYVGEFAT